MNQAFTTSWIDDLTISAHSSLFEFLRDCTFSRCSAVKLNYKDPGPLSSSPEWLKSLTTAVSETMHDDKDTFSECFMPCFQRYQILKPQLLDSGLDTADTDHHNCLRKCAFFKDPSKKCEVELDQDLKACVDDCFFKRVYVDLERQQRAQEDILRNEFASISKLS